MGDEEMHGCPMAKRARLLLSEPVAPEVAVEKMKEFDVLDQTDGEDDVDENGDGDSYSSDPDDLVEELLNEGLPDDMNKANEAREVREKVVLEEKGKNHFEVLPEGWVQATHLSGMPVYLHKTTRVCTVTKPYFLGPGSVRKHEIPLSAIPCLNYKIALEEEQKLKEEYQMRKEATANDDPEGKAALLVLPNAKIETVTENEKSKSLPAEKVQEYCRERFHFRTIKVLRFKSWAARRKYTKTRKNIKHFTRPTLPTDTKLITFPVVNTDEPSANNAKPKKEWIMNPNGKSYVCILHEYVQHALKKQPTYSFKDLQSATTPYSATVSIAGQPYGVGYGTSKKQAKSDAARDTLEILIPEMKDKITGNKDKGSNLHDTSVFDEIKIEDPRVAEFCAKTTEPSPHAILLTCLQRNYGLADVKVQYDINTVNQHKGNEFTMTVGKHKATVLCKNKKDGKQRAAQAILQILHPHIKTWGSLLRLYGNRSVKSFKEKKQEEQEITVLQGKATINQPNYAILNKLKVDMQKLEERRNDRKPIGKMVIEAGLPEGSGSNLNSVDLR